MIGIEFIFRLIGMVDFGLLGGYWGYTMGQPFGGQKEFYAAVLALVGALIGLVLTPFITTRPTRWILSNLS